MKIYSVLDDAFRAYGQIMDGIDTKELLEVLEQDTPVPDGVEYVASAPNLEALDAARQIQDHLYGGMPVQLGWCNGHNTKLNCLEYHRDSEIDMGATDLILLLARLDQIENGKLDTGKVKAFFCPRGVIMNLYATTLHFAPCCARPNEGFRMLVALPRGTNGPRPDIAPVTQEDTRLWGRNKWLLAHSESAEAAQGAYVGLTGENLDVLPFL